MDSLLMKAVAVVFATEILPVAHQEELWILMHAVVFVPTLKPLVDL